MNINWDKVGGLLPVVVQSVDNEVLMLAYMDKKALDLTLKTGFAHYFSRTKNKIWKKGESSGNTQIVKSMALDCDFDSLLIKVDQTNNVACHTGEKSCFFNKISLSNDDKCGNLINNSLNKNAKSKPDYILDYLYNTAIERKLNPKESSYISKLYLNGENSYLKKICEEAAEFAFALKDLSKFKKYKDAKKEDFGEHIKGNPELDAVYEAADIIFHIIVALALFDIHPQRVLDELKRREGLGGIEEKNAR